MRKKKRSGRPPAMNRSALLYLRTANGMSQKELATKVGLRPMDISRFEHGFRGLALPKAMALAQCFGVSCTALLRNDFTEIFSRMKQPIQTNVAARERQQRRQDGRSKAGYEGEDWVYQSELDKLAGTPYAYAVNPNYAGEERAGFDILSFTETGEWIYIEVKASKGGMNEPFYMSAAEYLFLQNCLHDGVRYELHRVCFVNDPVNRERIIYSARDVLEKFDCQINNYQFTPKKEVA